MSVPMPSSAQRKATGYSFTNGSLCIVRDSLEVRITGWPVPQSVMRRGTLVHSPQAKWDPFIPEFRLVHPYRAGKKQSERKRKDKDQLSFDFFDATYAPGKVEPATPAQRKKRALDQFRFSLPKPVAHVIEPFRTHQWPLLTFLACDEGALDLASNNPALAFFLAQRLRCNRELIESLGCSQMRQRELLDVLGLPSSSNAVKLFRKISPSSLNGDNWQSIIDLLKVELGSRKPRLNHLPSINSGVVEILLDSSAADAALPSLLMEVAKDRSENYRGRIVHLITSTLRMQDEMRVRKKCDRFASVERLRTVHDEVSEHYRRRASQLTEASQHESDHFRNPPIPGIAGKIEPVTSAAQLVDEGEAQGNCVASYASKVRDGNIFIYRILFPERSTLSIVRKSAFSSWRIGELEGRYNTDASPETEDFVQAWLDRHGQIA